MPTRPTRVISIEFPVGGLDKTLGYQHQRPFTTPLAMNVFVIDPPTGRSRGGVRPVLKSLATIGAPYGWSPVSYLDSGSKNGILVVNANGTHRSLDGVTWTELIGSLPASDFASCTYYNGYIYQAVSGSNTVQATVLGASEGNLSNAGGGTAPTNCGLVWVHQDRLALAGKSDAGHTIYMSAVGDATDWDYDDITVGGAWTNTGAEGGQIGQLVVAAINHNNEVSIVGSPRSMYAVVGNPRVGGTRRISHSIGPLMQNAWCKGIDANGNNSTFMMTYDGLYMIPAGDFTQVNKLSRNKIPDELIGINPGVGDKVAIGYDSRWPGIHISVDYNSGSDVNYFYHIPTDSYWPLALPITPHLYPTFPALQTSQRSAILPIGSAGSVRQYDNAENPGGSNEEFDSYVLLGPIMLGPAGSEGMLIEITVALAKDSENLNWEIYAGDTVEEAYQKAAANTSPDFTGTAWSYSGTAPARYLNYMQHPRVSGKAFFIRIEDVSNERWLMEGIECKIQPAGSMRRVKG